jgi:hypothetical protein
MWYYIILPLSNLAWYIYQAIYIVYCMISFIGVYPIWCFRVELIRPVIRKYINDALLISLEGLL